MSNSDSHIMVLAIDYLRSKYPCLDFSAPLDFDDPGSETNAVEDFLYACKLGMSIDKTVVDALMTKVDELIAATKSERLSALSEAIAAVEKLDIELEAERRLRSKIISALRAMKGEG